MAGRYANLPAGANPGRKRFAQPRVWGAIGALSRTRALMVVNGKPWAETPGVFCSKGWISDETWVGLWGRECL